MTHKLILKVKKFQLSNAKRFGTVEEKPRGGGGDSTPIPFRVKAYRGFCKVRRRLCHILII